MSLRSVPRFRLRQLKFKRPEKAKQISVYLNWEPTFRFSKPSSPLMGSLKFIRSVVTPSFTCSGLLSTVPAKWSLHECGISRGFAPVGSICKRSSTEDTHSFFWLSGSVILSLPALNSVRLPKPLELAAQALSKGKLSSINEAVGFAK